MSDIKLYEDLTNAQLKEECTDLGITVIAANPQKPNKGEYIEAISNYFVAQSDGPVEDEEETKVAVYKSKKSRSKLARLANFRKDRVIVHDTQENQSKDKDELLSISWGNRALGMQTDFIGLHGQPQYIRVGAIKNLKSASTPGRSKSADGKPVAGGSKRFVITDVVGLTPKELEELAAKQRMRNSKFA